ncbi:MAG TPA: hypothetical protein V6D28_16595 [Leptolyngbyaceae cyanobacterium]
MARRSLGEDVKARVKRLFEALLAYVNDEFEDGDCIKLDFAWQSETQVVIRTKRRVLEELTLRDKYEGQLTQAQVREALNRLEDFLGILEDNRTSTQGSEDWHFTLKLWHKDKEANLREFDIEWDKKRPPKSQAVAKKLAKIGSPVSLKNDPPPVPLNKGEADEIATSIAENIPPSNSIAFVGRDEQLAKLHQLLQRNSQVVIAAINGMGGVGKTELAIQYAKQHLLDYPGGICWINAQEIDAGIQILRFAEIQFK